MVPESSEKTAEVFSGDSGTTLMFLLVEVVGIVESGGSCLVLISCIFQIPT
jgi:hypothetical protein